MRLSIFQTGLLIILAFSASAGWSHDQTVSVNGYEVRVWTSGLEQRRPEQPVIVFENGSSSSLDSWGDFRETASQIGPVLFYDRATVGRSEWDGQIGSPDHVTKRLWSLLSHLEVEPPYVLVGWSWGADLAIQHARAHADDVVGIVLIDPPLHSGAAELEILKTLGVNSSAHNTTIARMRRELDGVPDVVRADVQPILTIFEEVSDPDTNLPPHIRVVGLVAGKRPDPPAEAIAERRLAFAS